MGLDMYLYRSDAGSMEEAKAIEDAFWESAAWDDDARRFVSDGMKRGFEEIAYWRKANQIHRWFMENCGADNCDYYPVSYKQLLDLMCRCIYIMAKSELVDGMVHNGSRLENGEWVPIMEEGKVFKDSSIAEHFLPTCEGFFFGSTEYDEWYMKDIAYTAETLYNILLDANEDDVFYYYPSW